jgi:hypothetical protein
VERHFPLDYWRWLTDHLVRDFLPIEFLDGVLTVQQSFLTTSWPD